MHHFVNPDNNFSSQPSTIDYYPFGQEMPGRVNSPTLYRYGFNGKENDNEVAGTGNWQNYGMREYDARVCRFISVDPLTKKYPELTPFQFASNTPIMGTDLDGKEINIDKRNNATQEDLKTIVKIIFDEKVEAIISDNKLFFKQNSNGLSKRQNSVLSELKKMSSESRKSITINLEQTSSEDNKDVSHFGDNNYTNTMYTNDLKEASEKNSNAGLIMTFHFFKEQLYKQHPDVKSSDYKEIVGTEANCPDCIYEYSHKSAIKSSEKDLGIGFKDNTSSKDRNNAELEFYNSNGETEFIMKINYNKKNGYTISFDKQIKSE